MQGMQFDADKQYRESLIKINDVLKNNNEL